MDHLEQDILTEIVVALSLLDRANLLLTCARWYGQRKYFMGLYKCPRSDHICPYPCKICPRACDMCGAILPADSTIAFVYGPVRQNKIAAIYAHIEKITICKLGCWFRCGNLSCGKIINLRRTFLLLKNGEGLPACCECGRNTAAWPLLPRDPIQIISLTNDRPHVLGFASDECIFSEFPSRPPKPSDDDKNIPTKFAIDPRWMHSSFK